MGYIRIPYPVEPASVWMTEDELVRLESFQYFELWEDADGNTLAADIRAKCGHIIGTQKFTRSLYKCPINRESVRANKCLAGENME